MMLAVPALFVTTLGAVHYARPEDGAKGLCACVRAAVHPGDACLLHAGRYEVGAERCEFSGVHGTEKQPIVIGSVGDGPVVLDGTVAIDGPWEPTPTKYAATTVSAAAPGGADILQLFIDGEMQVLARYPNVRWSDKSIFYAVENWFRSKDGGGTHDLKTHVGKLQDQGACTDPSECCGKCNTHDLATSGVNATGAFAVMNLWSCDTGVQRVTRHDKAAPDVLHYNATWVGLCDHYNGGFGRYFLEGAAQLLDAPEEWFFDVDAKKVLLFAAPPKGSKVRGRVSDYVFFASNVSYVTFANLSFHATTLSVTGDIGVIHDVTLSGLEFNYSAISRRAVGDNSPPIALTLWRPKDESRPFDRANFLVDDIVVRYSDGPALMVNGGGTTIRNSLFEWNDWTVVGGSWPLGVPTYQKAHRATTVWADTEEGLRISRASFSNNGAAQSVNAGGTNTESALIEYCSFEKQLAIQDDGAFVEGGGRPSTAFVRNWCSSTGKAALRWDGEYSDNVSGGMMFENVAWNTTNLMIKGDRHNVTGNTVFDGSDISPGSAMHDRPRFQDATSPLNDVSRVSAAVGAGKSKYDPRADNLTVFERNIFDAMRIAGAPCPKPPCKIPGQFRGNMIGTEKPFDLRVELRDPFHRDFRPCPNSTVARMLAGAYPPYRREDSTYWIPGRRQRYTAATPIPPSGSVKVHIDTELMFLPATHAVAHTAYFGLASAGAPAVLTVLNGSDANIARPAAAGMLEAGTSYVWRVDTHVVDGSVTTGAEWTLTTGSDVSCSTTPAPPAPSTNCADTEQRLCPNLAGGGAQKGDACYQCVVDNTHKFAHAGCWTGGSDQRHVFIDKFCGAS